MSKNTNVIEMCKSEYADDYEFELAVGNIVMFLLQNDYIMTIRYDEKSMGVIMIEYETVNQGWGAAYPYWLLPEEIEKVYRNNE